MIEIPALKFQGKSYPVKFQGMVPKRIRLFPSSEIYPEQEWEVVTDSEGKIFIVVDWEEGKITSVKSKYEVTEWYYLGSYSQCDWNPRANKPSEYLLGNYRMYSRRPLPTDGCQNEAVLCVGSKEVWHLCEECARLDRFKRFRGRKRLRND